MDVFLILVLLFYSLNFFTALKTNFELSTLDNLNLLITSIKSAKLVQEDFQHISIVPTYLIRKYMTPKILTKTVKKKKSKNDEECDAGLSITLNQLFPNPFHIN